MEKWNLQVYDLSGLIPYKGILPSEKGEKDIVHIPLQVLQARPLSVHISHPLIRHLKQYKFYYKSNLFSSKLKWILKA